METSLQTIYLDNAATTWPKPKKVMTEMVKQYLQLGVSPGRGGYDLAGEAEGLVSSARQKVAAFFGARLPERVIFTANATDSLNLAIFGLLHGGDHVITTRLEHNSVLRPLYFLQKNRDVTTCLIPFDQQGFVDPEAVARELSAKKTSLVVVNHASNVLGTVQPVEAIGAICKQHGVPLLVDASQSAGQVSVNMEKMQAAAIAFTGHKSLYAPAGIGGLVLHPELEISATRFGGTGTESKSLIQPGTFPECLETGTHNLLGIIGLSLALDEFSRKDITSLHEQEMGLARKLYAGLSEMSTVQLYGGAMDKAHVALFSAAVSGMRPEDVGDILDGDFTISVRTGLHCAPLVHETLGTDAAGTLRFSFGRYNNEQDVAAVIHAMEQITARFC